MEGYIKYVQEKPKENIDFWLGEVSRQHFEGSSGISDADFDVVIQVYEGRFGKRKEVGYKVSTSPKSKTSPKSISPKKTSTKKTQPKTTSPKAQKGTKMEKEAVDLPIAMMSLDKVKTDKELESFLKKNPGPYVISDKIDGNAALITETSLYNRGDGTVGTDLSYMLDHLGLTLPPEFQYVKGELVITKEDYKKYEQDYRTNLSMINGLLNSKSADPERLKLFKFLAYDIIEEGESFRMSDTMKRLEDAGFTVPFYTIKDTITVEELSNLLSERKENAEYQVDGLVICANRKVSSEERLIRENPKYMIAFKEYGESVEAVVERVHWECSKHKQIKPVLKIEPVTINKFTITSLTAFNAGWIRDNQVGPGTKILVTHNTIPYIMGIVESTKASFPENPETWGWNETQVDIILLEDNDEVRVARIYEFFKQLGAKYWGESVIQKLYDAGFDTVKILLESSRDDLLAEKIPGIGAGVVDRILKTRDEAMETITLSQIMSASSAFGMGFGVRKVEMVLDEYPNVMTEYVTLDQLVAIKGFGEKTAERFLEGLPKFKQFLDDIPVLKGKLLRQKKKKLLKPGETILEKTAPKAEIEPTVPKKVVKLVIKKPTAEKVVSKSPKTPSPKASPKPSKTKKSIEGVTVVFTGFRDKNLEQKIKDNEGKVTTSVSKNTTCLVVGGVKGTGSAKEKTAEEKGIPIYSLEEFKEMYEFPNCYFDQ